MSMIQVRNVPDDLHRELKVRAAKEGLTLSEYALNELRRSASVPLVGELRSRLSERPLRPYPGETAADALRAERHSR